MTGSHRVTDGPAPLLATKFFVPRAPLSLVGRPRLSARLERGVASRLTLVSAPAGFGKTTLLAGWLTATPETPRRTAWLSLDREDNDPSSFWTHVIVALQSVVPGAGGDALAILQGSRDAPPVRAMLTSVVNDLGTSPTSVVLVLDDYHLIESLAVHEGMDFLLEHLPEGLHLVLGTRADPPLALARLRARGQLLEVRASDLRFTPDEAVAYLNGAMGLDLTASDVAALEARTEGWIAALQLAALSMEGRDDVGSFIEGFAGDDRYVVDYLVEEVLLRQPPGVRDVLLQTSILDRLSGPLCDAVTGRHEGRATLEALDRANLFLVALDDHRDWYRYHRLFADVLTARLLEERPDQVPQLHQRASAWFAANGMTAEAFTHALAAGDVDRAAEIVELALPTMRRERQEATALGWMTALPDAVLRRRPVLSVHLAGALLSTGQIDGVEDRLRDAERWLEPSDASTSTESMVVLDESEFRALPSLVNLYRSAGALAVGEVAASAAFARRALELAGEDAYLVRGAAAGLLGLVGWASGDLEAGYRSYAESSANLERAGYLADTLGCAVALGDIRITQGRLADALRIYEQALQRAAAGGGPPLRGTSDMYIGLSEVHRERDDLEAAEDLLSRSHGLGELAGLPQSRYRWNVAMARIQESRGDLEAAIVLLDEAERVYVGDFFPNVRPVPAVRARVWIKQGNLDGAARWARDGGLSADDDLGYLREFEHVTLARLLVSAPAGAGGRDSLGRGVMLLDRLQRSAEDGQRTGTVIEILILRALGLQRQGAARAALAALEQALVLAAPQGYVRTFVDEGTPLAELLARAARGAVAPEYAGQLLTTLAAANGARARQPLVEPLSDRELEVLRLLRSDLDGPAIARELVVSLHTVRSHTKKIYAKLAVTNRRAAVRRAEELNLLRTPGTNPS